MGACSPRHIPQSGAGGSSAVSVAAGHRFESGLCNQKTGVEKLLRELTEKEIGLIQKVVNRGSIAEVKVENGRIVVIEIKRKKIT